MNKDVSYEIQQEDIYIENTLRPLSLDDFIGQKDLKSQVRILIDAAKKRNDSIDHLMFYGPPGLGKTTLCNLLAREMGVNMKMTSGPSLQRVGDIAALLTSLEPGDILFIDEIHRINRSVEETLYSAMEDYKLDVIIGKGPGARTLRLELNKFTIVGATTRIGMLSSPIRDRFGLIHQLAFYSVEELETIVRRSAKLLNIEIDDKAAHEIAKRSRGTPRIANRFLKRVRDYAQVKGNGIITKDITVKALDLMSVDKHGLTNADRKLLRSLAEKHQGGPVGLETLAASISEDVGTIETVHEPFLMQIGFLKRTPRGRELTLSAFEFLDLPVPQSRG